MNLKYEKLFVFPRPFTRAVPPLKRVGWILTMKKDILLRVLSPGLSLRVEDCAASEMTADISLTHLPAWHTWNHQYS